MEDKQSELLQKEMVELHLNHINHLELAPGLELCVSRVSKETAVNLFLFGEFKKQIKAIRKIWLKQKEKEIKKQLKQTVERKEKAKREEGKGK